MMPVFSLLYVDDEQDLLDLGKLFLEQSPDFHVDIQTSAQDALALPGIGSYDVIISDYQMPGMDGITFLKTVRSRLGNIPFILFTGRGREEVVIEAINNGADFYLQKGGDARSQFAELSHKIRQAIARRQAEYSLVESEKRLSDIIDFLPDATFAVDREGIIIAWNHAIEEMTGLPASAMLGKGDHEYALPFYGERRPILIDLLFTPDAVIEQKYSRIRREGNSLTAETDLPHPRGNRISVFIKTSPLYNREGELTGAIESIRDVTDWKKADDELRAAYEQITASEEELREQVEVLAASEQRIRENAGRLEFMLGFYERAGGEETDLMNYAVEGAGIVTDSPLGYLAFLNEDESELTMYAWSKSAMAECALREKPIVYKTEKTGLWGEAVRQRRPVITNDYAAPDPAKRGYPAGHPVILRHMNIPVIDDGHIVIVAGVANKKEDYTDEDVRQLTLLMQGLWQVIKQRRTKQALLASEEKYRDLFENSVLGIFRTTPEGKFSAINATFARISGYDSAGEMMDAIRDIRTQLYVDPADRDRFMEGLIRDGFLKNFEARYYHRDGRPLWILINAMAVRDAAGTIRYYEGTIEDITGQKTIEDALLREKIFSEAVIDSIPGLLYLYDSDGRLVRWNTSHATLTGYSDAELQGMHVLDWFAGDEEAVRVISAGIRRALEEGQGSAEAKLTTKDGRKIPFFFTAKRLEIEGKTYFTGVGIDLSDRKKAEDELNAAYEQITASEEELREQVEELARNQAALKRSEEKFRDIVETSPDLIWEMDTNGIFTYVSPRSAEILGYPVDDLIGRSCYSLLPDEFRDEARAFIEEASRTGTAPPNYNLRHRRRDGSVVVMDVHASIITDDRGRITGFRGISRDVTDRQKAEDELRAAYEQITANEEELRGQLEILAESERTIRESEGKYRSLMDLMPDAVVVQRDGIAVYANPECLRLIGAQHVDEIIGKSLLDCIHPDDHAMAREHFRLLKEKGAEIPLFEERLVRLDGQPFTVEITAKPILYEGIPSAIAVFRDISARKRAEIALQASENRYRQIIEFLPMGMHFYTLMPDGALVFAGANPAADRILKIDHGRFLGMPIEEAFPNLAGTEVPDQYRAVVTEGRTWHTDQIVYDGGEIRGAFAVLAFRTRPGAMVAVFSDITDRTRAEKALRESEERFRRIADNARDMIYRMTLPEGKYEYISPASLAMTGYSPEEFYADPAILRRIIHPAWRDYLDEAWKNLLEGRVPPTWEYQIVDRQGAIHWLNQRNVLVPGEDGRPVALEGIVTDITDRKTTDQAFRDIDALYRTLVENSHDIIFTMDPGGCFTFISPSWTANLGHLPADVLGRSFREIVVEEDIPFCEDVFRTLIRTGSSNNGIEFRVYHKDRSVHWYRTTFKPLCDDAGNVLTVIGNGVDFTGQRQARDALRESEQRYRSVIENIQDAFFRSDRGGRLTMASPSAARMLGFDSVDEILGRPMASFFCHPDDRQAILNEMAPEGKILDRGIELWRRDGTRFWGSLSAHLFFDEEGQPQGTEGVIHDITGYRIMEQALREANHKIGLLNSITRHDVANQLTVLKGFVQIASLKKTDPVIAEYLKKIDLAADTIARQLEFTKAYQELGMKEPAWTLVQEVVSRVPGPVPVSFSGTCRGVKILADPLIERVFFNLFENAVRHGGKVTGITVRCEREPDSLLIIVEDNGCGIAMDDKEKIFHRGFGRNSGLGLFLVREILSITGLTIRETGIPGKGARFEILVPKGMYHLPETKRS